MLLFLLDFKTLHNRVETNRSFIKEMHNLKINPKTVAVGSVTGTMYFLSDIFHMGSYGHFVLWTKFSFGLYNFISFIIQWNIELSYYYNQKSLFIIIYIIYVLYISLVDVHFFWTYMKVHTCQKSENPKTTALSNFMHLQQLGVERWAESIMVLCPPLYCLCGFNQTAMGDWHYLILI